MWLTNVSLKFAADRLEWNHGAILSKKHVKGVPGQTAAVFVYITKAHCVYRRGLTGVVNAFPRSWNIHATEVVTHLNELSTKKNKYILKTPFSQRLR